MSRPTTREVLFHCCLFIVVSIQSTFAAIQPIPCTSSTGGEKGICTFHWHCTNVANGVYMGTCVDRFFVGVCCKISQSTENRTEFTIRSYKNHPNVPQTTETAVMAVPMIDIAHFNVTLNTNEHYNPERKLTTLYSTTTKFPTSTENGNKRPSPATSTTFDTYNQIPSASSLLHRMFPSLSIDYFQSLLHSKGNASRSNPERLTSTPVSTTPTSIISWRSAFRVPFYQHPSSDSSINRNPPNDRIFPRDIPSEDWWRPLSLHETLKQSDAFQKHTPHSLKSPVVAELHNQRQPVQASPDHDLRKPVQIHPQHNLRKPVEREEAHDQRWPVIEDAEHDLRNPLTYNYDYTDGNEEDNASSEDFANPIPVSDLFKGIEILLDDKNKYSFASSTNNYLSVTGGSSSVPEEVFFSTPSSILSEPSNVFQNKSETMESVFTKLPSNSLRDNTNTYAPNIAYTLTPLMDLTQPQETFLRDSKKVCGRPRGGTTARIVGGRKTHHLRWPWMVSLREMEGMISKHICGATLLNHLWTITAAHCVEGRPPTHLTLRLGEETYRRRDLYHPSEERRVYVMVVHPGYNGITYENDLALLRTREPIRFGPGVLPACLPDHPYFRDLTGQIGIVTGWGRLAENGDLPSFLHQVNLPILSNAECESMYSEAGFVESIRNMFVCAGTEGGGVDACDGDSGGPMVVSGPEEEWTLVGIISWGMGCGAPKQPGVYIRITEFTSWINGIISH